MPTPALVLAHAPTELDSTPAGRDAAARAAHVHTHHPGPRDKPHIVWTILRIAARVGAVVSILTLGAFSFGTSETPIWSASTREWMLLACFPVGVVLGTLIGLAGMVSRRHARRSEAIGGGLALLSLIAFYAALAITTDAVAVGPWFAVFALPGLVMLVVGLAAREPRR